MSPDTLLAPAPVVRRPLTAAAPPAAAGPPAAAVRPAGPSRPGRATVLRAGATIPVVAARLTDELRTGRLDRKSVV